MKFTRTVTVTQVRRKIALAGVRLRCPQCGCELTGTVEPEVPGKPRKLPRLGEKEETGRGK